MIMEAKAVLRLFLVLACFTLAGAANNDNPANTCSVEYPLDLIFLVDTSSFNAATDEYKKVLDFIAAVTRGLDINEATTKIGVLLSNKDSSLILPLTYDRSLIDKRLNNVPSGIRSVLFTDAALAANTMIFFKTRTDAKIVLVVVRSAEAVASGDETYFKQLWNDLNASYIVVGVLSASETTETYLTKPGTFISLDNPSSLTESADRIRNAVCEATHCFFDVLVDVMFAISTTRENYSKATDLAIQISDQLDIKADGTYVGLVNTDPDYVTQPLNMRSLVNEALKIIPESWDALSPFEEAVKTIQGMYGGRKSGIKVIVFITDHESFRPQEDHAQAELAKSRGNTVFTIALTPEKDEDLLRPMASKPEYYLRAGDYSPLPEFIARSEVKGTCEAETCSVADKLDLIFIVDTSIDVATGVYKKVMDLISAVINHLDINEDGTKIGVVLSDNRNLILKLTSNKTLIDQRLQDIPSKIPRFYFEKAVVAASAMFGQEHVQAPKRAVVVVRSDDAVGTYLESYYRRRFIDQTVSFTVVGVSSAAKATYSFLPKPSNLDNPGLFKESANRISNSVCEATHCSFDVRVDVSFAISTTRENYPKASGLAVKISDTLDIKDGGTYVGGCTSDFFLCFLPSGRRRSLIINELKKIPKFWNIQSPINETLKLMTDPHSGRTNGIKVIIFIADHQSFKPQEDPALAELAKSKGYIVFTLGLTPEKDEDLLKSMASKPEYYLRSGEYSSLADFIARSEKTGTCKVDEVIHV